MMLKRGLWRLLFALGLDIRRRKRVRQASDDLMFLKIHDIAAQDPETFIEVMYHARRSLLNVETWIDQRTYDTSLWQYGLPAGPQSLNQIEFHPTYTDLILFLSRYLEEPISYLELGVSAGKNFLPICDIVSNATLTGLDIEEINPLLETFFTAKRTLDQWETSFIDFRGHMRTKLCSYTQYKYKENDLFYLSGNKFDAATWEHLKGRQFNLIFSDACHQSASLQSEYDMLQKFDLLNQKEFVIVWDDVKGSMLNKFIDIAEDIRSNYKSDQTSILEIHGSYGYENKPHTVGLVYKLAVFSNS